MKTIGLIGGMSWESSIEYYRIINQTAREKLGGLHSAKSLMVTVDFAEIEKLQHEGRWDDAAQILVQCAQELERGGADFIVLCTNTMHKVADQIQADVKIPFLHIADATAERIKSAGLQKIGLLGTRFTMEQGFYKSRLIEKYGLDVLVPNHEDRELVHRVIYDELCLGIVRNDSRESYKEIMRTLVEQGAQGIILGCTEVGLLLSSANVDAPVFDTVEIHCRAALEAACFETGETYV